MSTERAIAEAFQGYHGEVVTAGKKAGGLWVAVTLTNERVGRMSAVRVDITLNDDLGEVERHTEYAETDAVEEIAEELELCAIDFGHWTPDMVESSIGAK